MSAPNEIAPEKLARLIGLPTTPCIVDVRVDDDFTADPRLIPGTVRRNHRDVADWAPGFAGADVVVVCHHGAKLSQGVAAWLRHHGADAITLAGGHVAWAAAGLPLVPAAAIPPRDAQGRTLWVTRARPKVDRIACPWLIRRFIDRDAVFLFVAPSEVLMVAERFSATAFDTEGAPWTHDGGLCTFDTMLAGFGLATDPLLRFATIIRAADTARLDLAPEAAGLLAASLGLSRLHADDLRQLDAGLALYDAFFRWCRDATDETHNWPASRVKP